MNCASCNSELQIFAKNGLEIYVCPTCMSALVLDEPSLKALKHFCTQELLTKFIFSVLDSSFIGNKKEMLLPEDNLCCPHCKSYMRHFDLDNKLRFYINKCISCGALWIKSTQMPLVALSSLENNQEDNAFKKSVDNLYKILSQKRKVKIESFDDFIAPYVAIPLSLMGSAIPVGDNLMIKDYPRATLGLIVACTIILIGEIFINLDTSMSLIAEKIFSGEWYRLITYAFLHIGIFHLAGNMLFLWVFGRGLEDRIGWKQYLSLYAISSIGSGILFIATTADKSIHCVGASGAISGIIGAYLILLPRAKIKFQFFGRPGYSASTYAPSSVYIVSWVILNFIYGVLQSGGSEATVAYWGHIGGFISGVLYAECYKNIRRE